MSKNKRKQQLEQYLDLASVLKKKTMNMKMMVISEVVCTIGIASVALKRD